VLTLFVSPNVLARNQRVPAVRSAGVAYPCKLSSILAVTATTDSAQGSNVLRRKQRMENRDGGTTRSFFYNRRVRPTRFFHDARIFIVRKRSTHASTREAHYPQSQVYQGKGKDGRCVIRDSFPCNAGLSSWNMTVMMDKLMDLLFGVACEAHQGAPVFHRSSASKNLLSGKGSSASLICGLLHIHDQTIITYLPMFSIWDRPGKCFTAIPALVHGQPGTMSMRFCCP
jgi:hypothetical protein